MSVLDFCFPFYKCMVCKAELNNAKGVYLCDKCAEDLPYNTEPIELVNKEETRYFMRAFAPFVYGGAVKKLILQLKYNNGGQVAELFAPFMSASIRRPIDEKTHIKSCFFADYRLIPVPLCRQRRRKRGYNQAGLLAEAVGRYLDLPVEEVLKRTRKTTIQKRMSPKERATNLQGAFALAEGANVAGGRFIIIDDVFTSGSTANECAKVLREAGAQSVDVLVVARV